MTNPEKLIVILEARTADFEHALERRLKPALRKAITDVFDEFADQLDEFVAVREFPAPWFGKLSPEEAADMEVGFYGKPTPHFREVELTPEQQERIEDRIRRAIREGWNSSQEPAA